jgi:hypothetical protein
MQLGLIVVMMGTAIVALEAAMAMAMVVVATLWFLFLFLT